MEVMLTRLEAVGIRLIASWEDTHHFAFERGGYLALVALEPGRPARVGGAGLLTEKGLAPLIWKGDKPFFVAREFEQMAGDGEIESLRLFQRDLADALAGL
jgi:hypothetical protein